MSSEWLNPPSRAQNADGKTEAKLLPCLANSSQSARRGRLRVNKTTICESWCGGYHQTFFNLGLYFLFPHIPFYTKISHTYIAQPQTHRDVNCSLLLLQCSQRGSVTLINVSASTQALQLELQLVTVIQIFRHMIQMKRKKTLNINCDKQTTWE